MVPKSLENGFKNGPQETSQCRPPFPPYVCITIHHRHQHMTTTQRHNNDTARTQQENDDTTATQQRPTRMHDNTHARQILCHCDTARYHRLCRKPPTGPHQRILESCTLALGRLGHRGAGTYTMPYISMRKHAAGLCSRGGGLRGVCGFGSFMPVCVGRVWVWQEFSS